jgi:hypothetical protein
MVVESKARKIKKLLWWQKTPSSLDVIDRESMDGEIIKLLEEVEGEFKTSFAYHTERLHELKEVLRARQEQDRPR